MSTSSQRLKNFVRAYCYSFGSIPFEIIKICIAYCSIGEEFHCDDESENAPLIEGANHTMCTFPFNPHKTRKCFGRNIVSSDLYTYYHWRIIRGVPKKGNNYGFEIGIAEESSQELKYKSKVPGSYDQSHSVVLDLYVDFEMNRILLYADRRRWSRTQWIDDSKKYRLAIASCGLSFEIEEFNVANHGDSDINLALAMPLSRSQRIQYFESVMNANFKSFSYCDEYIALLIIETKYEKAYDFVLKYNDKKWISMQCITEIAHWLYEKDMHQKSKKIFDLLDDDQLKKSDWMVVKADNYYRLGDYRNAIKYFELCAANTEEKQRIAFCYGNLALCYERIQCKTELTNENLDKCIKCLETILGCTPPDDATVPNNLGYYYYLRGHYSESYKHLKKAIEIEPSGNYINGNMANLLYAMNKYDESIPYFEKSLQIAQDVKHPDIGPKCLVNYANLLHLRRKYKKSNDLLYQLIERNDFAQHSNKDVIYWTMSLNFERMKNIQKAVQYVKKAQKIAAKDLYLSKLKKLKYKAQR